MSVKLLKAGEAGKQISAFSPPSLSRTDAPLPYDLPLSQMAGARPATNSAAGAALDPEELLPAAHAEAQSLVAEARARAAEIEREARERGRAEAQAELHRAVADLRAQLSASLEELAGLRAKLAARAEQDLVRLALEIARKIVQRDVKVDHEVALTLARVALGRLRNRAGATVRLHPDDYAYVSAHRARLSDEAAVELIEDRSVGPGGCVVQSEMGEIDARIEQQFAEIEQDFLSA